MKSKQLNEFVDACCQEFKISRTILMHRMRGCREIADFRHALVYVILTEGNKITYDEVAQYFNRKNHTTICAALSKVRGIISYDVEYADLVKKVREIYYDVSVRHQSTTPEKKTVSFEIDMNDYIRLDRYCKGENVLIPDLLASNFKQLLTQSV